MERFDFTHLGIGLIALIVIALIALCVWLCMVVPYRMARKRGRSKFGWVVASMIFWPWAIIVLACLGDTDVKRRQRIIEEEELRQRVARRYASDAPARPVEQSQYNQLGKTINDQYHERYMPKK